MSYCGRCLASFTRHPVPATKYCSGVCTLSFELLGAITGHCGAVNKMELITTYFFTTQESITKDSFLSHTTTSSFHYLILVVLSHILLADVSILFYILLMQSLSSSLLCTIGCAVPLSILSHLRYLLTQPQTCIPAFISTNVSFPSIVIQQS